MCHIYVFAKEPLPGSCKTRLAQAIGEAQATRVASYLLQQTFELCKTVQQHMMEDASQAVHIHLVVTPDASSLYWRNIQHVYGFNILQQVSGDLGQRISAAIAPSLCKGESVLCIGMDCPFLTVDHLIQCFQSLDHKDVVLHPALDGGYVLIGLNQWRPELFIDIAWSTAEVCQQTLCIAHNLDLTVDFKASLRDIDTSHDLAYWPEFANLAI